MRHFRDYTCPTPSNFDTFHTTIPNVKLYYPEPFIASPTFMHDDIWFIHIVIYQYWLWFFFIFLIIFFFITFLSTVRWSNLRIRPSRETRGVSRSKCGDLITATVPVSWATSIIIHESTDAIEFSDGFGTTELAVGIRAYQWGWEYYYPKDLTYTFQPTNTNLLLGRGSVKTDFSLNTSKTKARFRSESAHTSSSVASNTSSLPSSLFLDSPSLASLNILNNSPVSALSTNVAPVSRTIKSGVTDNFVLDFSNNPTLPTSGSDSLLYTQPLSIKFIANTRPNYSISSPTLLPRMALFSHYSSYDTGLHLTNSLISFFSNSLTGAGSRLNPSMVYLLSNSRLLASSNSDHAFAGAARTGEGCSLLADLPLSLSDRLPALPPIVYLSSAAPFMNADQDFKRWSSLDLLEDLGWSNFISPTMSLTGITHKSSLLGNTQVPNLTPSLLIYSQGIGGCSVTSTSSSNLDSLNEVSVPTSLTPLLSNYKNLINPFISGQFIMVASNQSWLRSLPTTFRTSTPLNVMGSNFNLLSSSSLYEVLLVFYNSPSSSYQPTSSLLLAESSPLASVSDILTASKNLNVYSQAFQKVFKSTIEEERLSLEFRDLSSSFSPSPLLSSATPSILGSITKNSSLVSSTTLSYPQLKSRSIGFGSMNSLWLVPVHAFPFTLSSQSDVIRYLWFDWYSMRGSVSAKAADTSVFGLHGAKYLSHSFSSMKPQMLNQVDNFFNKYNHARKFYIPMSTFTPVLFTKSVRDSFSLDWVSILLDGGVGSLQTVSTLSEDLASLVWRYSQLNSSFYFSGASDQSFSKNLTKGFNTEFDSVTSISRLSDIHSSRSFIRHELLGSSMLGVDTTPLDTLNLLDFNSTPHSFGIKYKLSTFSGGRVFGLPETPLVSQYQPLRKGIANMIRIQADKAIAMPVETRLQILAVSKDIIHSWSIPSAGIKIDCIPGYSSHRVAIFLVSGVYWGQCMEICGRFHHWMPIVVYFMKRDLFCLWCSHFILSSSANPSSINPYPLNMQTSGLSLNHPSSGWLYGY